MGSAIWPAGKTMSTVDALMVSLSGIATVFFTLIALALAIVVITKLLDAMGLGSNMTQKKQSTSQDSSSTARASSPAPRQEDIEEYAVILAAVSEHTRVPIERLKINSITKK